MKPIFHPFRGASRLLGPLEKRLLEALWGRRSATVRELIDDCCDDLAYTTVMTTLDRLYKKDLLTRTGEGRAFRYAARFSREELDRQTAGEAFRQLLASSPSPSLPLSFLVEMLSDLDVQLLDDLGELVERKRSELTRELPGGQGSRDSNQAKHEEKRMKEID
jgi:predicted transcriptional regulator